MDGKIEPFAIRIPQPDLDELHQRLRRARWPDDDCNEDWRYGTNEEFLRSLVDHWLRVFDWRAAELQLNRLPQFTTDIDGFCIHFLHIRATGPSAGALVMTHGWPGSFVEMLKVAPYLTDPANHGLVGRLPFDLIVPSLPGFGFSSPPRVAGTDSREVAALWHELMSRLGFDEYHVQGGDIGAGVSSWLAWLYPQSVKAVHLNFLPGSYQPFVGEGASPLTPTETRWLESRAKWLDQEGGYSHLQGTKPQTLAYALHDSPLGLAAWIVEKFRSWSDCKGDVLSRFTMDELLTNISIYWHSHNVASTLRIYKENRTRPLSLALGERISPPLSFASFPKDICPPPREWVARGYNVVNWEEMPSGGHFAAMEEPKLLATSIHAAFSQVIVPR
jgi:pimeloyl-ACP methyl ester carboxylesterase